MSEKLSFVDAFYPIIWLWGFYGNDVNPRGSQTFHRRLFFIFVWLFHLAHSTFLMWYALASAQLDPDNFGRMIRCFGRIIIGNDNFFFKFAFFFTSTYATTIIAKIDAMLKKFDGRENAFLKKLKLACNCIKFYPIIGLSFHAIIVIERYVNPKAREAEIGSEQFLNIISTHPYLYYLLTFLALPLAYFQMGLVGVFIFALMWTLMNIFDELADSTKLLPNTEARKNIKRIKLANITNFLYLHREACEILRWVNRVFQWNLLEWLITQMLFALILARQIYHNNVFVHSVLPMVFAVILIATIQIHIYAKVNIKAKNCLCRWIKMGVETSGASQQALSAKVELYATHYQLDQPTLTAGGMFTFTPHLIVAFINIIFSYNLYLSNKQEAHGTSAAVLAYRPIHVEMRLIT
ncbi:hypothetical protein CHUAL_009952 [Chamberlinius hualienensis]